MKASGGSDENPLSACDIVVLGVILCVTLWTKETWSASTKLRRSNDESQALFRTEDSFFSNESVVRGLQECALALVANSPGNSLGDLFENSQSLAVGFNRDGISSLGDESCLTPFFEAVRDNISNAWVLNVLECDSTLSSEPPVNWHIDQTIALRFPLAHYAAHSVEVWYALVPDEMQGGELELVRFDDSWLDRHAMRSFEPHTKRARALESTYHPSVVERAVVTPKTNTRVTFRGDAHHRVRPFNSTSIVSGDTEEEERRGECVGGSSARRRPPGKRISIVLEQYRIPESQYWNTIRYFK